jgi:hypothetical protein
MLHRVKRVKIDDPELLETTGDPRGYCFTRHITITTKEGEGFDITLFGEEPSDLTNDPRGNDDE